MYRLDLLSCAALARAAAREERIGVFMVQL